MAQNYYINNVQKLDSKAADILKSAMMADSDQNLMADVIETIIAAADAGEAPVFRNEFYIGKNPDDGIYTNKVNDHIAGINEEIMTTYGSLEAARNDLVAIKKDYEKDMDEWLKKGRWNRTSSNKEFEEAYKWYRETSQVAGLDLSRSEAETYAQKLIALHRESRPARDLSVWLTFEEETGRTIPTIEKFIKIEQAYDLLVDAPEGIPADILAMGDQLSLTEDDRNLLRGVLDGTIDPVTTEQRIRFTTVEKIQDSRPNLDECGRIMQDMWRRANESDNYTWFLERDEFDDGGYTQADLDKFFEDCERIKEKNGLNILETVEILDSCENEPAEIGTFYGDFYAIFANDPEAARKDMENFFDEDSNSYNVREYYEPMRDFLGDTAEKEAENDDYDLEM